MPRAETDIGRSGRLKTIVPVVPDAPIGHFRLTLFGGKTRLPGQHPQPLRLAAEIKVAFTGQNGKGLTQQVKTQVSCGG